MLRRRRFLTIAGGLGAGPATGTAAGLSAAGSAGVIKEATTVRYADSSERFRFEYEYALPDQVTELRIEFAALEWPGTSLVETRNLDRDGTEFAWDGGAAPSVRIAHGVTDTEYGERPYGYASGRGAMAPTVTSYLRWSYRGSRPAVTRSRTFDGTGYAGETWSYAGEHDRHERTASGTPLRVVVPAEVDPDVDAVGMLDVLAAGENRLESRLGHDHVTAFVVPAERTGVAGRTVRSSMLVADSDARVERIENVPAHEYAHVLFGVFGDGEMYWLREGSAEYYGYLLSLNAGIGTFRSFLRAVRTDEYADAVLADADAVSRSRADYQKGAHVLAALDAEIRARSDGTRTLLAVLTSEDHDLATVDGFADAVVEAAGDPSLRAWLDRYVRTSALPDVPESRPYYWLRWRGTDPSPTPSPTASTSTPTASPSPSPTPTSTPSPTSTPTPTPAPSATEPPADATDATEGDELRPADPTESDPIGVTSPGFGIPTAVGGGLIAYLLARGDEGT